MFKAATRSRVPSEEGIDLEEPPFCSAIATRAVSRPGERVRCGPPDGGGACQGADEAEHKEEPHPKTCWQKLLMGVVHTTGCPHRWPLHTPGTGGEEDTTTRKKAPFCVLGPSNPYY